MDRIVYITICLFIAERLYEFLYDSGLLDKYSESFYHIRQGKLQILKGGHKHRIRMII